MKAKEIKALTAPVNYYSKVYNYLLSSINLCDYVDNEEDLTDLDKVALLCNIFNDEYNTAYYRNQHPQLSARLAEWFACDPSTISVCEYGNTRILLMSNFNYPAQSEEAQAKQVNNWFNFLASSFLELCEELHYSTNWLQR